MSTAGQECDRPFPQAESAPDITANKERDPFFNPSGSTHANSANSAVIHEGRDRISGMRCLAGWNFSMAFPTGEIQANHCQSCPVSGRKENPSPWASVLAQGHGVSLLETGTGSVRRPQSCALCGQAACLRQAVGGRVCCKAGRPDVPQNDTKLSLFNSYLASEKFYPKKRAYTTLLIGAF